ncbi:unnamed protein product [Ceutorhynchus assimilis]|uniref:HSF-type DNA-binding domain-containing protein n=1 Tax=Ceutorhynchus assimilis TaxID=467358 RepID=A0A9N9MYI8_9CUCU|nr:unnamed protein product [Ceutorhynchus assimilis]
MEEENATIEIVDIDDEGVQTVRNEPIINIVLAPECVQNTNALNGNIPLFIRKLWKMVNDDNIEDIIGWNENGDGFIIHDQLEFISKTLTKYFKHNQLSSFVRQLNLYDFHKTQQVEREELEFSHPFFLRDCIQLLPMIKRKVQTGRQKTATAASSNEPQPSPQVQALLQALKDVKKKNATITTEMSKLRQENASIWGEMNSLQLKYSKQSKIINKLIHFLITYMQKQHVRQPGRTMSTSNSNKYLKTGPKIMELDYRYRNNPHKFWSDFDSDRNDRLVEQEPAYTVVEPSESILENNPSPQQANTPSPQPRVVTGIEELLPNSSPFNQSEQPLPQFDHSIPSSSKTPNSALQRTRGSSENLGYLIDNSRVEMNSIKELFKSLTPEDMSNFYKLVNENYKNQEDELSFEIDNELPSLGQIDPPQESLMPMPEELSDINNMLNADAVATSIQTQHVAAPILTQNVAAPIPTQQMSLMQDLDNLVQESIKTNNNKMDAPSLDILSDDLLTDDLLSNVSVEQYFNID